MIPPDLDNPVFNPVRPAKPEICQSKGCLINLASYKVTYSRVTNPALLMVISFAPLS
jgi:hypothetical protein